MSLQTEYYSTGKTLWKFVKSSGVLGSGAVATAAFPTEDAPLIQWVIFVLAILPPILTAVNNWYKHGNKPTKKQVEKAFKNSGNFIILFIALGLTGCTALGQSQVKTVFLEETYEDGLPIAVTKFEAVSKGEVEASLHQLDYTYGDNRITVGQDSEGVTSPAQQALFEGWAHLIANVPGMLEILVEAIQKPVPPIPVEVP